MSEFPEHFASKELILSKADTAPFGVEWFSFVRARFRDDVVLYCGSLHKSTRQAWERCSELRLRSLSAKKKTLNLELLRVITHSSVLSLTLHHGACAFYVEDKRSSLLQG